VIMLMAIFACLYPKTVEPSLMLTKQPVLWRTSETPITEGNYEVHLLIKLESPCFMITNETVHPEFFDESIAICNYLYHTHFIQPMETMCPDPDNVPMTGIKDRIIDDRFVWMVVIYGVIAVAIVTGVALGISAQTTASIALSETKTLGERLDDTEKILMQKVKELKLTSQAISVLQHNFKVMSRRVDSFEADQLFLKRKLPITSFTIATIASRLNDGHLIILETTRLWKENIMNPAFFEFLNFTIPCGETCPIKHATPGTCRLSKDKAMLFMDFEAKHISTTQALVQADPFTMIHRSGNATCTFLYVGPHNAIINEECVLALNVPTKNLIMSPSKICRANSTLPDSAKYFTLGRCKASTEHDYDDFVQIKQFHDLNHIYCAYSTLKIGTSIMPCPNETFALPISADFFINDRHFKGSKIQVNLKESNNPLVSLTTNMNLQPQVNIEQLLPDIDLKLNETTEYRFIATKERQVHYFWLIILSSSISVFVALTLVGFICTRRGYTREVTRLAVLAPTPLDRQMVTQHKNLRTAYLAYIYRTHCEYLKYICRDHIGCYHNSNSIYDLITGSWIFCSTSMNGDGFVQVLGFILLQIVYICFHSTSECLHSFSFNFRTLGLPSTFCFI